ncbi:MAG: CPBP family intramembrane metalloprotease [Planctomycetes bacterium]|nr:CPBP family intramembrane metalloprotease [Planctomycetota bacterium]MCW8134039.1 CPBP family intramembrane metalloprotease [Planctomycetota bacterium]
MLASVTWHNLLDPARHPPAHADAWLLLAGLPVALIALLAVWRLWRRHGKPDGGLERKDVPLALALGFTVMLLPDILVAVSGGAHEPKPLLAGGVQVLTALGCIAMLAINPLRNDQPRAPQPWVHLEPKTLLPALPSWLLCYPVIIAAMSASAAALVLAGQPVREQSLLELLRSDDSPHWVVGWYLVAAMGAPLREEFAFRVVLFGTARAFLPGTAGLWIAGSISVFLFVLAHEPWKYPVIILPLAGLAVVLTLAYTYSRSIWPPVLIHALHNALVVTLQFFVFE